MLTTAFSALRRSLVPVEIPDGELIRSYVERNDVDAFAVLVVRHGPTVYGVCQRTLGNNSDADDAFQATFLVLIRKASSLADPNRVGSWLYGVAVRTANHARRIRMRRLKRERTLSGEYPHRSTAEPMVPADRSLIDREIAQLSDSIRAAIILCDIEGHDRPRAAQLLGIPPGTLSSRLAAGRKTLAVKLARKGLAPIIVTGMATPALCAHVPATLLDSTCRLAAGEPASSSILLLFNGGSMTWKYALGSTLMAGILAATAWGFGMPNAPVASPISAVVPGVALVELAAGPTVKDAPPVVIKTVPTAGSDDVDAETCKEIRVTFSKKMMDKSWSFATDESLGQEVTASGDVAYDKDKITCVMPVKLKPGTTYAIWLNSARFGNFKDADGNSALPYLLVFQTKK
ncbi:MAG: sigma-70 family RNA polymerase sigma factor [Gemmataceae bacterium]